MLTQLGKSFKNRTGKWKGTPKGVDKTHRTENPFFAVEERSCHKKSKVKLSTWFRNLTICFKIPTSKKVQLKSSEIRT